MLQMVLQKVKLILQSKNMKTASCMKVGRLALSVQANQIKLPNTKINNYIF